MPGVIQGAMTASVRSSIVVSRRARPDRIAEDHEVGFGQVQPGRPGFGVLVDHGEQLQAPGQHQVGQEGGGVEHGPGAELGDDARARVGSGTGHGGLLIP
jgi:hypothetical protein